MLPQDLARVAARFSQERPFVGWAVARYAESEGIDVSAVRRQLGASAEAFGRLCLCLRPRAERFAADVRDIAAHVGVNADALAEISRRADALQALSGDAAESPVTSEGTLLAARARKKSPRGRKGNA